MATYREVYDLSASIRQWTGRITKMTLIGTIIIYGGRVFGWW